jgi:ribonuclease BN (tRNA processing enzyme)
MKKIKFFWLILLIISTKSLIGQSVYEPSDITKVVLLGTGNPNPDPDHSGPAVAIVVSDIPYIIDFGAGIVRRTAAMSPRFGGTIEGLRTEKLKKAFLTHLHSDHTTGYPDLILTPWVMGRDEPLEVYGPEGLKNMTESILQAYQEDIKYRLYGLQPANNQGWRVNVHEIKEGLIYTDENVKVEAFLVEHGSWPEAYGYKFTTPDRVIVVSGDTKPCNNLIKYSEGVDILIHEVYYKKGFDQYNDFWKNYHSCNHTSTYELAEIANSVRPGLLIMYHTLFWGGSEEDILNEIKAKYDGKVVVGKDLEVY